MNLKCILILLIFQSKIEINNTPILDKIKKINKHHPDMINKKHNLKMIELLELRGKKFP